MSTAVLKEKDQQFNFSVDSLVEEAIQHDAINHPYLSALANGDLPNPQLALKDFAAQYQGYTAWFMRYLTATIAKCEKYEHRKALLDNVNEESGNLDQHEVQLLESIGIKEEWVQGIPHNILFQRFQKAMQIEPDCEVDMEAAIWREQFQSLIESGSIAQAIGAMGLGTECIVKYIYKYLIQSLEKFTDLTKQDYVFFEIHAEIDDEHGRIMLQIAEDLIRNNPENLAILRKGMLKALDLRATFWNGMYKRALKMS
ncbi:TenA family transcriptional regulator [Aliikangiella maris]|uniref:Iron-containing redox enzyme family protein n=2 Tax=Aliikangiella maris TaxID=3162458 RepID=A0ABV2BXW0_9GAMM